jgi:PPM family protein phosphatase
MKLTSCAKSDIGLSRNNNEDNYLNDKTRALFVVADGMGGHAAGDVASRIAIESVRESLSLTESESIRDRLCHAVEHANRTITQEACGNKEWKGMGTTLTILLIDQNQGYLAHVGDSRLYISRAAEFKQLSDDHSLIGAQLRLGVRTAEQAGYSNLGHILLQAVGITPELDICLSQFTLEVGDRLLLCSDGLTNMVKDAEIKTIVQNNASIDKLCSTLVEQALAAGGTDNITVLLIQIDELD